MAVVIWIVLVVSFKGYKGTGKKGRITVVAAGWCRASGRYFRGSGSDPAAFRHRHGIVPGRIDPPEAAGFSGRRSAGPADHSGLGRTHVSCRNATWSGRVRRVSGGSKVKN